MLQLTHSIHFPSLEAVSDYPHQWQIELRALKPGGKGLLLQETVLESLALRAGTFSGPTIQRGEAPAGMRTFSLLCSEPDRHYFRGRSVGRDDLIVFGEDNELEASSNSPISICNISIDTDFLAAAAERWGTDLALNASPVRSMGSGARLALERAVNNAARVQRHPALLTGAKEQAVQDEIVQCLLEVLCGGAEALSPPLNSYRTVRKALDFIRQNSHRPISLPELSSELGISSRALQLQFKKHLNASPKKVITQFRLSSLRRALRSGAGEHTSVSDLAFEYGFSHLSQLAQDYFKAFDELPSQTLRRSHRRFIAPR